MIPKASQRGNGADLATHLLRLDQNERISGLQIIGAIAGDLHGAFEEWELQAHNLTRCENYLYSTSISPDPKQEPWTREMYDEYIARMEKTLGLEGQPRALIFHEKGGREHAHVVWSRIKADEGKAVHLAFDHLVLMEVSRTFARDHGIELGDDFGRKNGAKSWTVYERAQFEETGLTLDDHRRAVTEAWQASDSARAFVRALEDSGYMLATGKRPYVVVDYYGHPHALRRMIDEDGVRQKDLEKFLRAAYPPEILPTVEEARQVLSRLGSVREDARRAECRAEELEELERDHETRRAPLKEKRERLVARLEAEQERLARYHEKQTDAAKKRYEDELAARLARRAELEQKGFGKFLRRVPGLRTAFTQWHRFVDRRLEKNYLEERAALEQTQEQQRGMLKQAQLLRRRSFEREERALKKVLNRERREKEKALAAQYRDKQRCGTKTMPAIKFDRKDQLLQRGGIARAMDIASGRRSKVRHKHQLSAEFRRAAKGEDERESDDKALRPRKKRTRKPRARKNRDPGRER